MGDGWGVVVVSARHVDGTRGSDIVSSAADVLWMSVVRGMIGVCGVCEKYVCVWIVDEMIGLSQSCGNRGVRTCFCVAVV